MQARNFALAGIVTAGVVALGTLQLLPGAAPVARASGLVEFDSCADLLRHYRDELERTAPSYGPRALQLPAAEAGDRPLAASDAATGSGIAAVGKGPTGTNVQEQGVDEPDPVKLSDGRLIVLSGTRLRIVSAQPEPAVLGSLELPDSQEYEAGELLLIGNRVLIVLTGWRESSASSPQPGSHSLVWPPGQPSTRVVLLELDGDEPKLVEEATYDAQYVSARLVDGTVRLVTTTSAQIHLPEPVEPSASELTMRSRYTRAAQSVELADVLPQVIRREADGSVLERGHAVSCDQTSYAPGSRGASTLLVTTLRPDEGLATKDRKAVTTDGDLVYASTDRLYVATSRWGTMAPVGRAAGISRVEVRTQLHSFDTSSPTITTYVGSGSVPGYVYGRWALSEHEGILRVATTLQPLWGGAQDVVSETSSMIVKLAEQNGRLVETGRISGLGRTEHIKAVRYFGDLAAVVTFRQTDPLYLIDLGDKPRVLGELKIPGFSTYLHPLGDGLLLGLGHDATDQGQVTGVQVSVFDISDPSSPRQVDRLSLGEGWTAALEDSRAFTYDPEQRVAAFGFNKWDHKGLGEETSSALGVAVSEDGKLTKAGKLSLNPDEHAMRVMFDGSKVFAIGETGVVAGDAATWARSGAVDFDHN